MKKILIIEDNKEIKENIGEILELEGFEVLFAGNGIEGVYMAKENLPDIILCDIMMPKLKGYEVYQQLKEYTATSLIPFVFITALAEKSEVRKGLAIGADGYIVKPFDINDLLAEVERCLKIR